MNNGLEPTQYNSSGNAFIKRRNF